MDVFWVLALSVKDLNIRVTSHEHVYNIETIVLPFLNGFRAVKWSPIERLYVVMMMMKITATAVYPDNSIQVICACISSGCICLTVC